VSKVLTLILLLSFLFSFSYALYFKIQPKVDALAYDNIALNIASGNGFRENVAVSTDRDFSIARVGPLYEYFLAAIYKLFGHNYYFVWFFQAILHALTAFLVYLTGVLIFKDSDKKEEVALWSAGILGFYPDLIEISAMLMTETLYLFLFCLMLYVFFRILEEEISYISIVPLGLVSGLAVLARPPVLFSLPVIVFYLYWKRKSKETLLFVAIFLMVLTPWTARNYNVYGEIAPFGVAGQLNFWIGNHLNSQGKQETSQEIIEFATAHPVVDLGSESIKRFKTFILEHPREFLKTTALRVNRYFSVVRPMGFWFYTSGWRQMTFVAFSVIGSIILFVLGLAGAIKMFKEQKEAYLYLLAFALLTPLILFITVVETRYRFQIYPLLAIFSGYFISVLNLKDKSIVKILSVATLIVFLNGGVDFLLNSSRVFDRLEGWF